MASVMTKGKKPQGETIDLRKRVPMTATATHPGYKAGVQFEVSPLQVEKLLKHNWAVEGHVTLPAAEPAAEAPAEKPKTK